MRRPIAYKSRLHRETRLMRSSLPTEVRTIMVSTPTYKLHVIGSQLYYWRVQARVGTTWRPYTRSKHFAVAKPDVTKPVALAPVTGKREGRQTCTAVLVSGASCNRISVGGAGTANAHRHRDVRDALGTAAKPTAGAWRHWSRGRSSTYTRAHIRWRRFCTFVRRIMPRVGRRRFDTRPATWLSPAPPQLTLKRQPFAGKQLQSGAPRPRR